MFFGIFCKICLAYHLLHCASPRMLSYLYFECVLRVFGLCGVCLLLVVPFVLGWWECVELVVVLGVTISRKVINCPPVLPVDVIFKPIDVFINAA